MHRFRNRAENNAVLFQFFFIGRRDRNAVEHGIDRHAAFLHARQNFLLLQRNAELVIGFQQFGIDFVERLRLVRLFRRGIIRRGLIIDFADD